MALTSVLSRKSRPLMVVLSLLTAALLLATVFAPHMLLMFRPEFMPSSRVATRTAIASYAVSTWLFWIVRKLLLLPLAATAAPPAKMPKMLVVVPAPPPLARMLQFLIVSKVAPALVPWLASQAAAVFEAVLVF